MACMSLECFIPELSVLAEYHFEWPPILGGQNFHHGCLLAVNESLSVVDGQLFLGPVSHFEPATDISGVLAAAKSGTICDSQDGSAPEIRVPFEWCTTHLPGWQLSSWQEVVGPLVQFILPCIAFCYNIPRKWKLRQLEHNWLIPLPRCSSLLPIKVTANIVIFFANLGLILVTITASVFTVSIDTIIWMATCFASAGPMIISSTYEYRLDWNNIDLVCRADQAIPFLDKISRTRLLLCTLTGSLALKFQVDRKQILTSGSESTWKAVMTILEEIKELEKFEESVVTGNTTPVSGEGVDQFLDDLGDSRLVLGPEQKLRALVDAQPGFGGVIGAPIVFFIGGFGYNIISSNTTPGNSDAAFALAFGMWWMAIPHIAIIANSLIAINNPSVLEGLLGRKQYSGGQQNREHTYCSPYRYFIREVHQSSYEPVILRERGRNKQRWMIKALQALQEDDDCDQIRLQQIRKHLTFGIKDWVFVLTVTILLLSLPFAFSFTLSFLTPQYGLSCDSFTHLVYFLTQIPLLFVWSIETVAEFPLRAPKCNITWVQVIARMGHDCTGRIARLPHCLTNVLKFFLYLLAVFTAVGGTLMQIGGIYYTCICLVDVWAWTRPYSPNLTVSLSNVTASGVNASANWNIIGALASATLAWVTAIGWWHQRGLRKMIMHELGKLSTP